MHVILKAPPETTLQVEHAGKTLAVRFERGAAFVPRQLGLQLIRDGLVVEGELPDPPPRFECGPDGSHGRALNIFGPYVREVMS